MSLTEAEVDTPLCNALESNALDSFDLRAWKSLAKRLERDLAQIRLQGQESVATVPTPKAGDRLYAAPPVPQGMVLVPVEPTEEMLTALRKAYNTARDCFYDGIEGVAANAPLQAYNAMLSVAQGRKNG